MGLPRRIAWLGPPPTSEGGVAYMSGELLRLLAGLGIEVTAFVAVAEEALPASVLATPGLRFVCRPSPWRYDRWYSSNDVTKLASGMPAKATAQRRIGEELLRAHAHARFDAAYLFNSADVSALRGRLSAAPPLVMHPEVHAAGELRWMRAERALASTSPRGRAAALVFEAAMHARAAAQRRGIQHAELVIAPSRRFSELLTADLDLDPGRVRVVPNPIDLARFQPGPVAGQRTGPVRLLFVSRLAVRKGVEMIVALSQRLVDLAGRVELEVVGDRSLWSDYRHLLAGLDASVAHFRGPLAGSAVHDTMRRADALLCPSHYEPFGLTVGEALASGVPVVASDAVGAAEDVSAEALISFAAGDLDALETATREMVRRCLSERQTLSNACRAEAERLFSGDAVAERLEEALTR